MCYVDAILGDIPKGQIVVLGGFLNIRVFFHCFPFEVRDFHLFGSMLHPDGAVYVGLANYGFEKD